MDFTADVKVEQADDFVEYTDNPEESEDQTDEVTNTASEDATTNSMGDPKEESTEPAKTYACEVCDIASMSEQNYDFHMKGQRHQKNMKHRQLGLPIIGPQYGGIGRKPTKKAEIETILQGVQEPVIGLQYITEQQKEGQTFEPSYLCELCNSTMDPRVITSHLVGYKHRLSYMEKHYPDFHQAVVTERKKRSEASAQIEEFARQIETKEGRGEVKVKMELNPFWKPARVKPNPNSDTGNAASMKPVVGDNPNVLMCKACNIIVNGPLVWEQHVRGTRHQRNVGVDPATAGKDNVVTVDERARIQDDIDKFSGKPLIGLEYIEEFQKPDSNVESRYVCTLCEGKCDPRTLFSHLTGAKHRINYIKKHLPETGKTILAGDSQGMKKSEIGPVLEKIAEEIESKEGRKAVIVKIDKNDFSSGAADNIDVNGKRKLDSNHGGPPFKMTRGARGRGGGGESFGMRGRGGDPRGRGRGAEMRGRGRGADSYPRGRGMDSFGRERGSRARGGGRGRGMDGGPDSFSFNRGQGRGWDAGRSDSYGLGGPARGQMGFNRVQRGMLGRGRGGSTQGNTWGGMDDYHRDKYDAPSFSSDNNRSPYDYGQQSMMNQSRPFDRYDAPGSADYDSRVGYSQLGASQGPDGPQGRYQQPTRYNPHGGDQDLFSLNRHAGPNVGHRAPGAPNYFDFTNDMPNGPPLPNDPPPMAPPPPLPLDSQGPGSGIALAGMLKQMTQCLVNNEDEADVALQVSNALTQALLSYRMKGNDM